MSSPKLEFAKLLEWLFFAGFGGAVRFVAERMKAKDTKFSGRDVLLFLGNGFISGFSGLMGALMLSTLTDDYVFQLVGAGMFGYFGTAGIEKIGDYVMKKVKV